MLRTMSLLSMLLSLLSCSGKKTEVDRVSLQEMAIS